MLRGGSPPRPPGRVPRLDQCSPCSACGTRRTAAGAGGQSDGLPGDPKTVDSFTSHRYLSIPPWARPCFPRLSSTSSPGHCPQFATGMGSCPLSLPRGGECPPRPHSEAAVHRAMALFGLWAAGSPAAGRRGASPAPPGSGPSWSQGAGRLLSRGLPARTPDGAGHPSADRRMFMENLPRAGPGSRSRRLSLRKSPF